MVRGCLVLICGVGRDVCGREGCGFECVKFLCMCGVGEVFVYECMLFSDTHVHDI